MKRVRYQQSLKAVERRLFLWRWAFAGLQTVISCKVQTKVPRHHIAFTQIGVDDDAFGFPHRTRHTPRGIAQMASRLGATRSKLTHHAGQTLRPVAGAKNTSRKCEPQDVNFFGRWCWHEEKRWRRKSAKNFIFRCSAPQFYPLSGQPDGRRHEATHWP